MKVFGQLENAQLENRTADYTGGVVGRAWWNSTVGKFQFDDGTNIRALIRNDQKAIFGSSGTANTNVRINRSATGLLQFVLGGDTTAEGSLSTSVAELSSRLENYTNATKPNFGNAGRAIWVTDVPEIQIDSGAAWISLAVGNRVGALYDFVVGTAGQVAAGIATHSTWASAIAAAVAGQSIKILEGTWVENVTITKQLYIEGNGYGSYLNGSFTFDTSSDRSYLTRIRVNDNITLNSAVTLCKVDDSWLPSGKSFVDNGTGNLVEGFQET